MAVARTAQKWWIENMVYPCMERYRGNRIREQLGFLQEMDRAGQGAQRAQQELALRRLLLFCGKRVPAYRDVLASADMVERDVWSALAAVPILSKEEFRDHPERYLAEGWNPASRIPNETGGSTGIPLHFFMDRQQVESYEAARWRGLSWYGITPETATLFLVMAPDPGRAESLRRQVEAVLPGVVITTRIVDAIPPTPSGKSRYTIREFPLHP